MKPRLSEVPPRCVHTLTTRWPLVSFAVRARTRTQYSLPSTRMSDSSLTESCGTGEAPPLASGVHAVEAVA
ncbi:MAG TPA: hypothetical protein VK307_02815 [Thermoleophilaceae bacterium]|nr:hypothetical protein [Thermoleophilaceae bacterium]